MKKLLTFFLLALLTFGVGWAETVTYTFTSKSWEASPENWTGTADGNQFNTSGTPSGVQVTTGAGSGATVTCPQSYNNISSIVVNYSSSSRGVGSIAVYVGNQLVGTQYISKSQTKVNLTYSVSNLSGVVKFVPTVTANSMGINSVTITYTPGSTPPPVQENWYRKVTSASSLVAGKKYIIVNEASGVGMGALNSNRYGVGVTGLTFDNGRVDIGGTDVMEMTLGGSSNAWTFNMGGNQYLSNTSSSTSTFFSASSVNSSATDITKWTITPSADACAIQSNYVTAQYIRYNSSGLFGTYGINSQSAVALYVEDDGSTPADACADPVFDPDGGIFTGSASVTITSATEDATIYYTTDGTDPVVNRSSIANGGTVELTESCTLKAMAVKSGMENSNIVTSQAYTINPAGGSDSKIYRKVTSTDDLVAGQKYIIMLENANSSVGMGAYDGSKHFNGVQNLTISNDKVNIANTEVLELTLGGTTGAWTLYTGSGYIQGADAVQFNIVDNATAANSKWIITNSVDNTNGFVVKNAQYDRYIKCYSNSTFRHYGSGNGSWAYLYVQTSNNEPALHAEPNPLNINDTNEAGGKTGTIYVSGENLGGDNVGVDSYDPNHSTNFSSNPGYFSHNGTVTDYPVAITYTGQALSATGIVYPANNIASTSVNIN